MLYSHQVETFEQFYKKFPPHRKPRRRIPFKLPSSRSEEMFEPDQEDDGQEENELFGNHIIITTPGSSGKSMCFSLCVFDRILKWKGEVTALCLFPHKALVKDQEARMKQLNSYLPESDQLTIVSMTGMKKTNQPPSKDNINYEVLL